MKSLRLIRATSMNIELPCLICDAYGCPWDQIGNKPICTDCQERIMLGEIDPWQIPAEEGACLLCSSQSTIRYLTFPLCDPDPIEMDLCGRHLHALISRSLTSRAYRRLRRHVNRLGFAIEQFFLLHEAFYDEEGQALQPFFD